MRQLGEDHLTISIHGFVKEHGKFDKEDKIKQWQNHDMQVAGFLSLGFKSGSLD